MNNIYLELTRRFNSDQVRAILAGGQAVVLKRLARYLEAAEPWAAAWPALSREMNGLALSEAHRLMVRRAETLLPLGVPGGWP